MNFLKLLSVATAGLLPVLGLAQFTVSFTDTKALPNDTTTSLLLSKFDPSLYGTLTGVYLSVGVNISGANVQVDNDSTAIQTGTAKVTNLVNSFSSSLGAGSLQDASFSPVVSGMDLQINQSQAFLLDATSGDPAGFNATGFGDSAVWTPGTISAGNSGNVNSLLTSLYQGSGDFLLSLNATYGTSASFSGSDGWFQGNTPSGQFTATVTYTYIPEPSTYALILGALTLGMIGWRRFRK